MNVYDLPFQETLRSLADRARQVRLVRGLRQDEVASRAGVGIATVRRFETTGAASIENVLRIATALGVEAGFEKLFEAPRYASIDEALARPDAKRRQRVRKRR